jgi:hypothetical protein
MVKYDSMYSHVQQIPIFLTHAVEAPATHYDGGQLVMMVSNDLRNPRKPILKAVEFNWMNQRFPLIRTKLNEAGIADILTTQDNDRPI